MHQLCFDIHHLVLTTAKCQLIVPPSRKHNAENIFRSQSFERIGNFVCLCACRGCLSLSCQDKPMSCLHYKRDLSAFCKRKDSTHFGTQQKVPQHAASERSVNFCYNNYRTRKQQESDNTSQPGSKISGSRNIIFVHKGGCLLLRRAARTGLPLKCCSSCITANTKTV